MFCYNLSVQFLKVKQSSETLEDRTNRLYQKFRKRLTFYTVQNPKTMHISFTSWQKPEIMHGQTMAIYCTAQKFSPPKSITQFPDAHWVENIPYQTFDHHIILTEKTKFNAILQHTRSIGSTQSCFGWNVLAWILLKDNSISNSIKETCSRVSRQQFMIRMLRNSGDKIVLNISWQSTF
jgi:hypothetical protein